MPGQGVSRNSAMASSLRLKASWEKDYLTARKVAFDD